MIDSFTMIDGNMKNLGIPKLRIRNLLDMDEDWWYLLRENSDIITKDPPTITRLPLS